jgi:molybdopterin converting factor small subunit
VTTRVVLPRALVDTTGGARDIDVTATTVAGALDELASAYPRLGRRLRDEAGALRRHVNIYVDGSDVRAAAGLATPLPDGSVVHVLPSVAGG